MALQHHQDESKTVEGWNLLFLLSEEEKQPVWSRRTPALEGHSGFTFSTGKAD